MKAPRFKDLLGIKPELRRMFGDDDEGGVLVGFTNTIVFGDTATKNLFVLPSRAKIIGIHVNVSTVFNSSGTDLLNIGKTGSASFFKASLDVSALGQTSTGWVATSLGDVGATDIQVNAIYAQSVADATTGALTITFLCLIPN